MYRSKNRRNVLHCEATTGRPAPLPTHRSRPHQYQRHTFPPQTAALSRRRWHDFDLAPLIQSYEAIAQTEIEFRTRLAEYSTAFLALRKANWHPAAYQDATRHHKEQQPAVETPWKGTEPAPFAR